MAITAQAQTALGKSTTEVLAKALDLNSAGTTAAGGDFVLGLEQRGFIRDFLNRNNPLAAYTQMIDIMETGAGSVTVKWDGADNPFVAKAALGNGDVEDIDQNMQVLFWNKPVYKSEGLSAYDIKKGVLNTLAYRMEKSMTKFTQGSIKRGFEKMVTAAKAIEDAGSAGDGVVALTATTDLKAKSVELVKAATKFITDRQLSRNDIVITIDPITFDDLAFAGLIGDRTSVTYSAGQYSVSTLGGYRIQSGEVFMSGLQTGAKGSTGADAQKPVLAIIAPTNSVVSKIDIVAANTGKLGISNDVGTYIELADINAIPKFIEDNKLVMAVVGS